MKAAGLILAGVLVGGLLLWNADRNDRTLNRIADCIHNEARAEGYRGTIDKEAWDLFAGVCANRN